MLCLLPLYLLPPPPPYEELYLNIQNSFVCKFVILGKVAITETVFDSINYITRTSAILVATFIFYLTLIRYIVKHVFANIEYFHFITLNF